MIVSLTAFKRRPGLDVDAFRHHWATVHADLGLALPGLRRYVQHRTLDSAYRRGDPAFDGLAETWWDDLDALRSLRRTPEAAAIWADEANLLDPASRTEVLAEPHVVVDGEPAPGGLTMFVFVARLPHLDPEAFHRYWLEVHGPIAARVPGVRRYVQHHVPADLYATGRTGRYDGVAQFWFDDLDAARASGTGPEHEATIADQANFMVAGTPSLVTTPLVMR